MSAVQRRDIAHAFASSTSVLHQSHQRSAAMQIPTSATSTSAPVHVWGATAITAEEEDTRNG